ncbi:polysaccharide biosynthesis tyrosine autokinase [Microbacterium sp. Se5.02b]|uniref:polysaccharide biosynthesis tyrosine autokinase n=1 Tax=Microbacterium sp. Se5.02b TaxID=2864103 RepID=UPI001C68A6DD|nr:polysaccharide biosynthesis tyrosine autokinase [Microbacterium sp. Se5.02b]QYM65214.1 polysaccharide biosynthesis tyrosine autokinase [Microbacterium sp. Se5.02b]
MDIHDYLRVFRRQIVVIIAGLLIGLSTGALVAMLTPQRYQATTEVMVTAQVADTATPAERALATGYAKQAVETYRTIITSSLVLAPVVEDLGLDAVPSGISATSALNSTIVAISVSHRNPGQAARIANAVAESFATVVTDTLEKREQEAAFTIRVVTLEPAQVPTEPVAPNLQVSLMLGAVVGLAAGIGVALLRATLDRRVRVAADVEAAVTAPLLGQIPLDADTGDHPLAVSSAPHSLRAEAFRSLRTNVRFFFSGGQGVFVVTSSGPGEGKSTTAANLALAFADAGQRVALLDGDLRLPRVAEYFDIEGGIGLSDVLAGRVELNDVLQRWGRSTLFLLPSGTLPPNPAELLGSSAMEQLIDALSDAFDVVIIDAPPLLLVTDAAVIARVTTGALLIAAAGSTQANRLADAVKSIESVGARVLGTVLTKAPVDGAAKTPYGTATSAATR